MNNKEKQIIEMLQKNKTYGDIQEILQVSPSRISQIKKKYQNGINTTITSIDVDESYEEQEEQEDKIHNKNTRKTEMETPSISNKDTKVELLKLELDHQQEIERIKMEERAKEREFELAKLKSKERITKLKLKNKRWGKEKLQIKRKDLNDLLRTEYNKYVTKFLASNQCKLNIDELENFDDENAKLSTNIEDWHFENRKKYDNNKEWKLLEKIHDKIFSLKGEFYTDPANKKVLLQLNYDFVRELENSIEMN